MLEFKGVSGPVLVKDHFSCQDARPGLALPLDGRKGYVVVTGPVSSAELNIEGQTVSMGPSSVLRAGIGPTGRPIRSGDVSKSEMKIFIGRVWDKVYQGKSLEDAVANAVVGVRG